MRATPYAISKAAQQVHLLLEPESAHQADDDHASGNPEQAWRMALRERGDRRLRHPAGGRRVSPNCAKSSGEYSRVVRTVQRTARNKADRACPEAVANRVRNAPAGDRVRYSECIEKPGKIRADNGTGADERRLHGIAGGVLVLAQHIADECAERLHRDVKAGVERPQQNRRHDQLCRQSA